jgi:hypothetical protein
LLGKGSPAISVDTKKKELIGEIQEWRPASGATPRQPERVPVHDFGKVKDVPYGVYDLGRDAGWVNVGTDHDTSAFAVESIRQWWHTMGRPCYPQARQLLITADGGGSNGSRVRLWKLELQKLADQTSWLTRGRPRQFWVMKENSQCSILFHLLAPGGEWQTAISRPVIVNLIARHNHQNRAAGEESAGHRKIPEGNQGQQGRFRQHRSSS